LRSGRFSATNQVFQNHICCYQHSSHKNPSTRSFPKIQSLSKNHSFLQKSADLLLYLHNAIIVLHNLPSPLQQPLPKLVVASPLISCFTKLLHQASPLQPSFLQIINSAALIKKVDDGINSKILITDPGTAEKSGTSFPVTLAFIHHLH
jgi:hypothetical protein